MARTHNQQNSSFSVDLTAHSSAALPVPGRLVSTIHPWLLPTTDQLLLALDFSIEETISADRAWRWRQRDAGELWSSEKAVRGFAAFKFLSKLT